MPLRPGSITTTMNETTQLSEANPRSAGCHQPDGWVHLGGSVPAINETRQVPAAGNPLTADTRRPDEAKGLVLFAHGSGSSRHSPRNRAVAAELQQAGLATVLVDLLTPDEERLHATHGAFGGRT